MEVEAFSGLVPDGGFSFFYTFTVFIIRVRGFTDLHSLLTLSRTPPVAPFIDGGRKKKNLLHVV